MRQREQLKNLLVTGRPGSGKTTLVESVARKYAGTSGGFYTREIRERGIRKGFQIVTLDGETAILAHAEISSPIRVGKYGVDMAALERLGVSALRDALQHKRIIVFDEIGRMEIASQEFRTAVVDGLDSDRIVLATIQTRTHRFTDGIKARPDVRLFALTSGNQGTIRQSIEDTIASLLV